METEKKLKGNPVQVGWLPFLYSQYPVQTHNFGPVPALRPKKGLVFCSILERGQRKTAPVERGRISHF